MFTHECDHKTENVAVVFVNRHQTNENNTQRLKLPFGVNITERHYTDLLRIYLSKSKYYIFALDKTHFSCYKSTEDYISQTIRARNYLTEVGTGFNRHLKKPSNDPSLAGRQAGYVKTFGVYLCETCVPTVTNEKMEGNWRMEKTDATVVAMAFIK